MENHNSGAQGCVAAAWFLVILPLVGMWIVSDYKNVRARLRALELQVEKMRALEAK